VKVGDGDTLASDAEISRAVSRFTIRVEAGCDRIYGLVHDICDHGRAREVTGDALTVVYFC